MTEDKEHGPSAANVDQLGLRLQRICEMSDEYRRSLSPAVLDQYVQTAIARAMGTPGRIRATDLLCEAAEALVRQAKERQAS